MRNLVLLSVLVLGLSACADSTTTGASTGSSSGGSKSSGTKSSGSDSGGGTPSGGSANGGSSGTVFAGSGGSGTSAGGSGTCPAYQSCKDQGAECGKVSDGCGNLEDCGDTCTAPQTCGGSGVQNVCGSPPCTPKTCGDQGFDCGDATDGCGTVIHCGSDCPSGETCGAQQANVCDVGVCTAKSCNDQGFNCGSQGDGCGVILDCGTCPATQICGGGVNPQNGVCGTPACVPHSCADEGYDCGQTTDGCGVILDCGTCAVGQVCGHDTPNVCGGQACPVGSNLIYVWDTNNVIHSFDPLAKTFATIATPDCPASSPNSMAVDRNLVAWLNYLTPGNGSPNDYIYKFDLKTKTGCVPSGITLPNGFHQVGMGFSTDMVNGTTEKLYIDGIGGGSGLAYVDFGTNTIVKLGTFGNDNNIKGQSAELTGTGAATLFGYFTTTPYVRVAQLDKTNSNAISDNVLTGFTPPSDWAFSFFGGDFFMYAWPNSTNSPTSNVVHYAPATNTVDLTYIQNVGFTIIGAGVSTCAQTTACTPKDCTAAGAQCGPAGDGCGNIIQCGTCGGGQVCLGGVCTTDCTGKSCNDQGFVCGMQGDTCGNALNCGTCPANQNCNNGQCTSATCHPKTCAQQGYTCGSIGDGCGDILTCGSCPSGQVCGGKTPGQCEKPACTPKTCTQQGFNCGQATDTCGTVINCGTCSSTQTCGGNGTPNVCGGGIQ